MGAVDFISQGSDGASCLRRRFRLLTSIPRRTELRNEGNSTVLIVLRRSVQYERGLNATNGTEQAAESSLMSSPYCDGPRVIQAIDLFLELSGTYKEEQGTRTPR